MPPISIWNIRRLIHIVLNTEVCTIISRLARLAQYRRCVGEVENIGLNRKKNGEIVLYFQ